MCRVKADAGEILKSCLSSGKQKGECSKPIFQIVVYYYELFYTGV